MMPNRDMAMFIHNNNSTAQGEKNEYFDALDRGLEQSSKINPASGSGAL